VRRTCRQGFRRDIARADSASSGLVESNDSRDSGQAIASGLPDRDTTCKARTRDNHASAVSHGTSCIPFFSSPSMAALDTTAIHSWHAHVYFDAAWAFRQVVDERFGAVIELGRFHERLVGPHPAWSYQIAFDAARFDDIVPWLVLNHGALDIFLHPNTNDELRDHRDCAAWIGKSYALNLDALAG
jgi:aromatic ring-cleaving dioxygenase